MTKYNVGFSYLIREGGATEIEADTPEQARDFGLEYVTETYDDIEEPEIDFVEVIK